VGKNVELFNVKVGGTYKLPLYFKIVNDLTALRDFVVDIISINNLNKYTVNKSDDVREREKFFFLHDCVTTSVYKHTKNGLSLYWCESSFETCVSFSAQDDPFKSHLANKKTN
jgi:hypothetical protein